MPFLAPLVGAIAGGGWLTQLLVGAVTVGASLLFDALKPKPVQQAPKDPGVSLDIQIGGTSPLSFIVGIGATAGHRVYAGSWGQSGETPNAYFADVLEIANVPVDGLNNVYVEGELATILTGEEHADFGFPIQQGRVGATDYLWVKFYRGDQTVADPYLRSKFGSHPDRPYDAGRVGYGTAYAIVTTRYNRQNWNGRPPKVLFEVRGIRCYDIRKDSTAGGSGAHRRETPSTWEFSKNPYVIAYNAVFMGVYFGSEWVWGLQGLPISRLPTSAWVAAMNEADRTLAEWDDQIQFEIGGEVTVDTQPADFLDEVAASSLGRFIESAGSYKPRCGVPGASVWSFGEAELLITDPRTFTPFPGLDQTVNAVEINYTEPGEAWGSKAAPEVTDAAYIAADGNRKLPKGLNLRLVTRNEQAQRLGYSYLHDGRRFRTFTGTFHPIAWQLEPGDVIEGTILAEGYDGKAFEILQMSGRRTFAQTMTIREVDPDDFDPPESAYQEWSVGPIQTIYPPSQPATGISFAGYILYDNSENARRPGIEAFYQGGMDDVQYFAVQVRRAGDTLPFFENNTLQYRVDVIGEASQPFFSQAFAPNLEVEVRGRYVPFTSRETDWSSWMAVTLPNVKLGALDVVYGDIDLDELGDQIEGYFDWMGGSVRELYEKAQEQDVHGADQELANAIQFDELRRSLSVVTGDLQASFEETITVAIVPMQGQLVAIADSLTELSAGDGTDVTTARFRMTVQTGEAGGVTIGAQGRTGSEGAWREAGYFLYVPNDDEDPTRFTAVADQFVITSEVGASSFQPFVFEGGNLRVVNAYIANLTASNIEAGSITGDRLEAGTVTADKIDVADLFAESAAVSGVLTVGSYITIDGPNGRIVVSD